MLPLISSTIVATLSCLFFLVPGFVFLRSFWGSEKGPLHSNNIYGYLIWGTPISLVLFYLSVNLFNSVLCEYCLRKLPVFPDSRLYDLLFKPLNSQSSNPPVPVLPLNSSEILGIVLFFVFINLLSFLTARGIRYLIMFSFLDCKFNGLRFKNDWFYLLAGRTYFYKKSSTATKNKKVARKIWEKERKEWQNSSKDDEAKTKWSLAEKRWVEAQDDWRKKIKEAFFVEVVLLCEMGGQLFLYKGKVDDYKLKEDSLDYISLWDICRTLTTEESQLMTPSTVTPPEYLIDFKIDNKELPINISGFLKQQDKPLKQAATVPENPTDAKFYPIDGSSMIFKASEIKNFCINYKSIPAL